MNYNNNPKQRAKAQEIILKVFEHLIVQGERAMDGPQCVYRAPDGNKCAAGCLIPDELYSNKMEGSSFRHVAMDHPKLQEMFGDYIELIGELQQIHDNYSPWDPKLNWNHYMLEEFQILCRQFGLDYSEIFDSFNELRGTLEHHG